LLDRRSEATDFAAENDIAWVNLESEIKLGQEAFQTRFGELIRQHDIHWLGLSFNRLLSQEVIDALDGRIFNLHLSLLPAFPSFGPIRRALAAGVRMAGVTIHLVDGGVDTGPVLAQGARPVGTKDDEASLGWRLFEASLPLTLQVVRSIACRELTLDASRKPVWPRAERPGRDESAFPEVDWDLMLYATEFCARLRSSG
jgi:phosphoribosylglycinamide formyltransferase-1